MKAEVFKFYDHAGELAEWLHARGLPVTNLRDLPESGLIIRGVAAGFIRRCEGNVGIIDSYITNPQAPGEVRNEALDLLTASLLKSAKELGLTKIIGFSVDTHTIARSLRHGFRKIQHVLIVADLTEAD